MPDYVITPEEIEDLAERGEKFKVLTFANKSTAPGFIFDGWEKCGTMPNSDPEFHKKCLEPLKPWIQMGMVPTFSCNNYLVASYLACGGPALRMGGELRHSMGQRQSWGPGATSTDVSRPPIWAKFRPTTCISMRTALRRYW